MGQTQNWEASCTVCNEPITNPVCIDCLGKQVQQWLFVENTEIELKTKNAASLFSQHKQNSFCVTCGNSMSVCSHCFTKEIYGLVLQEDKTVAQAFVRLFDYGWNFLEAW